MSQQPSDQAPPVTGNAEVDAVVGEIDALADRPLGEHPAAFEAAHERLRRALDVVDDH